MNLRVNGENKIVQDNLTVAAFMGIEGVEQPDMVSVQLNGAFVDRNDYPVRVLKDQDEIDFLYFMGGGQ